MIIGKKYKFDAAHFLPGHPKCGKLHGHTWKVEVELVGEMDSNGMVFDFGRLDKIMEEVLADYDHTNLNDLISNPTCEMIACRIKSNLITIYDLPVNEVKVQEGEGGWAII